MNSIERVTRALDDIRAGKMVILVDDEDRENEGDLVFAAEKVTAEHINFMATHARGLICLAMDDALIDRLELEAVDRLGVHGEADEPAPVRDHEVDRLGRGELGGEAEVALVLAVLVVDEDHHPAGAQLVQDLGDRAQRHPGLHGGRGPRR